MGMDIEKFMSNRILGNVRTGKRGNNDVPVKLDYFDVHKDKSTSSLAVELFNSKYKNPKTLKIQFVSKNPMELYLERYEGRKRRCFGNGSEARVFEDNGKEKMIKCSREKCEHWKNKKCKYIARIYVRIYGLEEEGVWCFPIKSKNGIRNIAARISRANRLNEDITKKWYEIYLYPEDAPTKGVNYIPDLRDLDNKAVNSSEVEQTA